MPVYAGHYLNNTYLSISSLFSYPLSHFSFYLRYHFLLLRYHFYIFWVLPTDYSQLLPPYPTENISNYNRKRANRFLVLIWLYSHNRTVTWLELIWKKSQSIVIISPGFGTGSLKRQRYIESDTDNSIARNGYYILRLAGLFNLKETCQWCRWKFAIIY